MNNEINTHTMTRNILLASLFSLFFLTHIFGAEDIRVENKQEKENHHHKLATKIIGGMRLSDTDKSAKLIAATVTYLDTLEKILKVRAAKLQQLDRAYTAESTEKTALIVDAYEVARDAFLPLKKKYVSQLADRLTPYQVDRVKDGPDVCAKFYFLLWAYFVQSHLE